MLSSFRRLTKSKSGGFIIAIPAVMILGGFALADLQNFGTGSLGFGMSPMTVAEVGNRTVSEQDLSDAMRLRLEEERQRDPDADYPSIASQFDGVLQALVNQQTLIAFADKIGFNMSKRLVDAEIAQIPQAKGLNGQFSDQAYRGFLAQRRMTDEQVRTIISGGLLQRYLLASVSGNPRLSVGMATPYASMLLEAREGEALALPVEIFARGLTPSAQDLSAYYNAIRARYTIPEQRVLRFARITPEALTGVEATDKEIADYYKANAATYAGKDLRDLSQVVVNDRKQADAIAARARGGASLNEAATAVAGAGAAVSSLKAQTRDTYSDVAGAKGVAAVFGASAGSVVGPLQSEFGWAVVKVDASSRTPGKTVEQARGEIVEKLNVEKRRQAIEDRVNDIQNAIDDGANFAEAMAGAKLTVESTPLVTARGTSLSDRGYKLPAELASALRGAFESTSSDPPEVVATPDRNGYVVVAPGDIVPAAPPPLASIQARVAADWTNQQALKRAKAASDKVMAALNRGASLADAAKQAGAELPPIRQVAARRMEIANAQGEVPPALVAMFSIAQGKSKLVPAPGNRGYLVIKLNKVTPGNALLQPGLIAQMQNELQAATADAYAQQFIAAAGKDVGLKVNDKAVQEAKKRIFNPIN